MNYGLYLSASGVLTNMYRQDVFANNLANVQTVGFKPDFPAIRQRDPEAVENGLGFELRRPVLDELTGGSLAARQRISFAPGLIQNTSSPLDAALTGRNAFFVARSAQGDDSLFFTRDGRFTRNEEGYLVLASSGHQVLDANDQPIRIDQPGPLQIEPSGKVSVAGQAVAQLQITGVDNLDRLVKQGQNLFRATGGDDARTDPDSRQLHVGAIETSGVDPIRALVQMIDASRSVGSHGEMIRYHDMVLDRAVNVLGRVQA